MVPDKGPLNVCVCVLVVCSNNVSISRHFFDTTTFSVYATACRAPNLEKSDDVTHGTFTCTRQMRKQVDWRGIALNAASSVQPVIVGTPTAMLLLLLLLLVVLV